MTEQLLAVMEAAVMNAHTDMHLCHATAACRVIRSTVGQSLRQGPRSKCRMQPHMRLAREICSLANVQIASR